MRRTMMKSKIHRATVTAASIDYQGSITVDSSLLKAADIQQYEQVHVFDITNGARLVTYAIPGDEGEVCINGAAARKVDVGDLVIILSFGAYSPAELAGFQPHVVKVDSRNRRAAHIPPDSSAPGASAEQVLVDE
ncbi:aspartate 1-decarboxylase precursor [bacterium BMS3Abin01]|nr:aspartate 1-decarboxylase precursor [bacterium BMS3Abin01]HDY69340.1 aspartate 1-decarboxylase [Actinomycetota bacterium]